MCGRREFRIRNKDTGMFLDSRMPKTRLCDAQAGQRVTMQPRKFGSYGRGQIFHTLDGDQRVYNEEGLALAIGRLDNLLVLDTVSQDPQIDTRNLIHFNNDGRIGIGEKQLPFVLVPDGTEQGSKIGIVQTQGGADVPAEKWEKVPCGFMQCNCM